MARVYVATSWRNKSQPLIVKHLQGEGHEVYDFRNPMYGSSGFRWSDIDVNWKAWTKENYRHNLLNSPIAAKGFLSDFRGMQWCNTCLLVLPCGRSAHLELGWCAGAGKRTIILLSDGEPELMNLIADHICLSLDEAISVLR